MTHPAQIAFVVTADGWVAGRRRSAGDIVRLTAAAARHEPLLAAHHGTRKAAGRKRPAVPSEVEPVADLPEDQS